jgi:hypothetical protein
MLGQPRLELVLLGIQVLAQHQTTAGRRLLAALLDVKMPGARLIPRLCSFANCRQLQMRLARQRDPSLRSWADDFAAVLAQAETRSHAYPAQIHSHAISQIEERPYFVLRRCLADLVTKIYRRVSICQADQVFLGDMLRLEIDAYQERISRIARLVDPYQVGAIARIFPLLSESDAEIHDMREFVELIQAGDYATAFHRPVPRWRGILDESERKLFDLTLNSCSDLAPLAAVWRGTVLRPLPISVLAASLLPLFALTSHLCRQGWRSTETDLLTTILMVQQHSHAGRLNLEVAGELRQAVANSLTMPVGDNTTVPPYGQEFRLVDNILQLQLTAAAIDEVNLRHDLPAGRVVGHEDDRLETTVSGSGHTQRPTPADIKQLVLHNLDKDSILLGFLRNPRIVPIAGLVTEIVNRCRSLPVLLAIAQNNSLIQSPSHQDVPVALLRSPCRIPIASLRKFINVRYVPRVELKRLARDRCGVRSEVIQEIEAYLMNLS